jgi:succinoglycan biosynthesis transport protein ExoP
MANNKKTDDEQESGHPAFSRLSILRTLRKRAVRIAAAWIVFALAGAVAVRFWPSVYQSEAVVLIDTQKIPEKFVSATVASDLDDRMAEIRQTLLSGGELKKIIDDYGLYKEARKTHFDEEILEMMRKDITITLESVGTGSSSSNKRTAAFRIGYQGSDPALVMRVANRLTDLYVEQNLRTREGQAEGTTEFLDAQLREAKKQLDELEATVSAYKLQHNGELPQQEQSLSSTLSRLQTELEVNRDAINRTQQTRVILEGNLNAMEVTLAAQVRAWEQSQHPAETTDGVPATSSQRTTLQTMQDQLGLLRTRYSDNHPDVIRLRALIAQVKKEEQEKSQAEIASDAARTAQAAHGTARAVPSTREPVELAHSREQVAGLKAQIRGSDKELEDRKTEQQRILSALDQYQHRIERLPVREQEMAQITRNYEMSKENYKSLLDKKMAAEMALDMERRQQSERFTVLDRAQLPEKPIKPNRPVLYAGAAGLGLVLALALGFLTELRKNVVLGEWELPEDATILARLPYIEIAGTPGAPKSQSGRPWFGRRKGLAGPPIISAMQRL